MILNYLKFFMHQALLGTYRRISSINHHFNKREYERSLKTIRQKIRDNKISKIHLMATGAIGDAVVNLPLYMALKKSYARDKNAPEIIAITSPYNDWVLKPFLKTKIYDVHNEKDINDHYAQVLKNMMHKRKSIEKKNELYIDTGGDQVLCRHFEDNYIINFKDLFLNRNYSDYAIGKFSTDDKQVTLTAKEGCEEVLGKKLDVVECPSEIISYMKAKRDRKIDKYAKGKYIVFYVGNKPFRALPADKWKKIIEMTKYDGTMLIVDDPAKNISAELEKTLEKKPGQKIVFVKEEFDLWTLSYLASRSELLIAIDGGGFNFMHLNSNVFEMIPNAREEMWKPYSKNPYNEIYRNGKHRIIETITSQGKIKRVYFIKSCMKKMHEVLHLPNSPTARKMNPKIISENIIKIVKNVRHKNKMAKYPSRKK